jgi:hypothetical protein
VVAIVGGDSNTHSKSIPRVQVKIDRPLREDLVVSLAVYVIIINWRTYPELFGSIEDGSKFLLPGNWDGDFDRTEPYAYVSRAQDRGTGDTRVPFVAMICWIRSDIFLMRF